jgi:hypothetical protein
MKTIITSLQIGAKVNKTFWKNIQKFKKEHGVVEVLAFVMNGQYVDDPMHPSVAKLVQSGELQLVERQQYNLHKKVKMYDTKVLAQNINCLHGQSDKLPEKYSYIMPGTKVRFFTVANIGTNPRFFQSTGAMTEPHYVTVARSSNKRVKRGIQATEQHQLGFVYFQDNGRGKFDTYNVTAQKGGNFHYLKEKYHSGKMSKAEVEVLVLGDIHHGVTNKYARAKYLKQIETLNPNYVVLHDFFDGESINHHNRHNLIDRIRNAGTVKDSLESELKSLSKEMNYLSNRFPEVKFIVAESNHDAFLRTYVKGGDFHDDYINYIMGTRILLSIYDDLSKKVLEESLKFVGKIPKNFKFLRENDSFKIRGVQLAQHGHKGSNGARGSALTFKRLNLKMISGHTHSPQIYSNGMIVGTNTILEQGYTIGGASSWMHANGILYPDGTFSLLTFTAKQPVVR